MTLTRNLDVEIAMKTLYKPSDDVTWINVDDRVMGGVSLSTTSVRVKEHVLRFEGSVSLENNGGFCSTRTEGTTWDLSEYQTLIVDAAGRDKRYKLTVRSDDHESGGYRLAFETSLGRTTYRFDFSDFEFYRRGTHFPTAPPLDPTQIHSIGFLISDGQAGDFALDIHKIGAE